MKCPKCNNTKKIKGTKFTYDYSKESGIKGCLIESAKKYTCKECKEIYFDLGDMDEVFKQMAIILCSAETLTRSHIKWIRKDYLKLTYFQFAKIVRKNPEYLKELELHKRPMTEEIQSIVQGHLARTLMTKNIKVNLR